MPPKNQKMKKQQKKNKQQQKQKKQKETKLGIQYDKESQFALWYPEVIAKAEMVEKYNVSGCYILRPHAFRIWELVTKWFDDEIKKLGVENAYFPMFVTADALQKEKDHVEGFSAEVAWVTKNGNSDLPRPVAIRPTSETIMYPAFSKWIRSHRDLPMKLNQWTNVVRWEFKHPTPFLRTREFLWQEGHTAHATSEEADTMVMQALELYRRVYEELYAVPVVMGRKSEKEKFAGGLYTTSIEGFIPTNGRAIQAATSHCLGQNFSKMFDIDFLDVDKKQKHVHQTSWGFTTRSLGVMIMVHGDNNGLVIPPRVAPIQAVIISIKRASTPKEIVDTMHEKCEEIYADLKKAGVRIEYDDRDSVTPGWKYSHWELKGVPLRIELGPRDLEQNKVCLVRRDNREKIFVEMDKLATELPELLEKIQSDMLEKARSVRDSRLDVCTEWSEFMPALDARKMALAPWCERSDCEEEVKNKTKDSEPTEDVEINEDGEEVAPALSGAAKTLNIPFDQPEMPEDCKCFACGRKAVSWTLWGRSY